MIKYYDYISESKLDMIFPQIPNNTKEKTSIELGFDLGFIKSIFKTESDIDNGANLITKVMFISNFIIKNEHTTDVKSDGDWAYEESIPLYSISPKGNKNISLFVSKLGEKSFLILCGSKKNVIGKNKLFESSSTYSYQNDILDFFESDIKTIFNGLDKEKTEINLSFIGLSDNATTQFNDWSYGSMFNITNLLVKNYKYPTQKKSLLARIFFKSSHVHENEEYELIVGSPIYIADAKKYDN